MSSKLIYFLILVLIVVSAFYLFSREELAEIPEINFSERGNLTLEEDDWFFVYEKPGSPALSVELNFKDYSLCFYGETEKDCSEIFEAGDRVEIEGNRLNGVVEVISIKRLEEESDSGMQNVNLYYYNPELDKDEDGNILCSDEGLVPVSVTLPRENIIENTIQLLIQGQVPEEKAEQGVTTEFPLNDFALESVGIEDGILVLTFEDPANETTGGSCRVSILRSQIEKTALQFEEVQEVVIMPETIFQP
jgi:hypothetical protein